MPSRHRLLAAAVAATALSVAISGPADAATKSRPRQVSATTATPGVSAAGGQLLLNGVPTVFNGINAYNATTDWSVNYGCGSQVSNLDSVFASVPTGSLVRTWAFQALGFNKFTHTIDFAAIDRVVAAAKAHGDYLIFALSDQSGTCDDGHWHDKAWYDGGYDETYNDNGRGYSLSMSYLDWVRTVVSRYANDPTVAVYEPVNEPEASNCAAGYTGTGCHGHTTCPVGAINSLRGFYDTIGWVIKSLDVHALVSTGTLGGSQCGVGGAGFSTINASPSVDIATYHDYNSPTIALPTELSTRASQAAALGKVFLVEESGINGSVGGVGCSNLADRATQFLVKIAAAKSVGADAYLPWNWASGASSSCSYTIAPGDPLLKAVLSGSA